MLDGDVFALLGEPAAFERPGRDPHARTRANSRSCSVRSAGQQGRARVGSGAQRANAVVVYKGPDTIVASPDGRLGFAPPAPAWLATAGTGDVLAGITAAMRARGLAPFDAACAAVWLHGRAAEIAGPQMIADDLAAAIPRALASME